MTDPIGPSPKINTPAQITKLREVADDLEATFLSEMLKSAGVGKSREAFGGGIGEDQFGSFLRDAHAKAMVRAGGIGLSETLFNALKERSE